MQQVFEILLRLPKTKQGHSERFIKHPGTGATEANTLPETYNTQVETEKHSRKEQDAIFYSTLELASGYWKVEMEESDKEKTAFATLRHGLFNVMPFGWTNAPGTFETLMSPLT